LVENNLPKFRLGSVPPPKLDTVTKLFGGPAPHSSACKSPAASNIPLEEAGVGIISGSPAKTMNISSESLITETESFIDEQYDGLSTADAPTEKKLSAPLKKYGSVKGGLKYQKRQTRATKATSLPKPKQ
jgi:hypothetical protein